jgi:hypothetical protein
MCPATGHCPQTCRQDTSTKPKQQSSRHEARAFHRLRTTDCSIPNVDDIRHTAGARFVARESACSARWMRSLALEAVQQRLAHPDGAGEEQHQRRDQHQDAEHVAIESAFAGEGEEAEAAAQQAEDAADQHQDGDDAKGTG